MGASNIHSWNLGHWLSKCGPQTGSIHMAWELIRNINSHVPPQTYWVRNTGWGLAIFQQALQMILMQAKALRISVLKRCTGDHKRMFVEGLQWQSWIVVRQITQPAKSKIRTEWVFTENVCRPLLWAITHIHRGNNAREFEWSLQNVQDAIHDHFLKELSFLAVTSSSAPTLASKLWHFSLPGSRSLSQCQRNLITV